MTEEDLMEMDIDEAVDQKYQWGKEKYRINGEDWAGLHPLIELHSEGLDTMGYAMQLRKLEGIPEQAVEEFERAGIAIILGTRMLYEALKHDEEEEECVPPA
ncbi:MAG: hypothetical protein V3S01_01035 [Dehalococcoidia bacterium]